LILVNRHEKEIDRLNKKLKREPLKNRKHFTIQAVKQIDGFFKVDVLNYGVTWAKDIEDIGVAVKELVHSTEQREKTFKF
jgi:hypothetical protein